MALRLSTALRNALLGLAADDGSLKDLMADGIIEIYSGSQPADANAAETGTKLVRITVGSAAFTSGVATNGLELGVAASGSIAKAAAETWSGVGLATGTAGWFRWYANTVVTGLVTTTGLRMDGTCGTSGAQLILSSVSIVTGATITIDSFTITLPANV